MRSGECRSAGVVFMISTIGRVDAHLLEVGRQACVPPPCSSRTSCSCRRSCGRRPSSRVIRSLAVHDPVFGPVGQLGLGERRGDLMHAEERPLPDLAVDTAGQDQRTGRVAERTVWHRPCRCKCAPFPSLAVQSFSSGLTADEPRRRRPRCRACSAGSGGRARLPHRRRRRAENRTTGSLRPPSFLRRFFSSPGVLADIAPSAEIHSAQTGSQPGSLLRTTTKRMGVASCIEGGAAPAGPMPS